MYVCLPAYLSKKKMGEGEKVVSVVTEYTKNGQKSLGKGQKDR